MSSPPTFKPAPTGDGSTSTLKTVQRALQYWVVIAICGLLAGITAFLVANAQPDQYQSSASIASSQINASAIVTGNQSSASFADAEQEALAIAQRINLPRVRLRASKSLGGEPTPDDLAEMVTTTTDPDSRLVTLIVTHEDPAEAKRVADAMIEAFIGIRRESAQETLKQTETRLRTQYNTLTRRERNTSSGRALRDQFRQAGTLAALADGGIDIVQVAQTPDEPIGNSPKRKAAMGFLGGALLGFLIVLVRVRLDDRVHFADDFVALWPDLPVAGFIPRVRSVPGSSEKKLISAKSEPPAAFAEAHAYVRSRLRHLPGQFRFDVITLTAGSVGQGTSTVAWNLAVAAADAGDRVLVIDGDRRRRTLSTELGVADQPGFTDVVTSDLSPLETIAPLELPGGTMVDVLPAGTPGPQERRLHPTEATERIEALLSVLRGAGYSLIVIDAPPATAGGDALALMSASDATLIVNRVGAGTTPGAIRLREQLSSEDHVVAQVVNGAR